MALSQHRDGKLQAENKNIYDGINNTGSLLPNFIIGDLTFLLLLDQFVVEACFLLSTMMAMQDPVGAMR